MYSIQAPDTSRCSAAELQAWQVMQALIQCKVMFATCMFSLGHLMTDLTAIVILTIATVETIQVHVSHYC